LKGASDVKFTVGGSEFQTLITRLAKVFSRVAVEQ